jgi:hypothetical protein
MTETATERTVGKTSKSQTYHYLSDDQMKSLCGTVNNRIVFTADITTTLTQSDAEQRDYSLCRLCADYDE